MSAPGIGANGRPHAGLVVRALIQDAVDCEVVDPASDPERRYPMGKHHELGFFEDIKVEAEDGITECMEGRVVTFTAKVSASIPAHLLPTLSRLLAAPPAWIPGTDAF